MHSMHSPRETLSSVRNRAAEITWWNRRLTKLDRLPEASNLDSFLSEDLIQMKGPYLEFVKPPATDDRTAVDRLTELDFSDKVINALVAELFGGNTDGTLYQHQAEMITAIRETAGDNILTVPTATGKTESFLLPVLDSCLTSKEDGLTALVIYPMKTLAVDQLNRFVRYLHQINHPRSRDEQVTIGIWDGDTASSVGTLEYELEPGAYIRGLEDPMSGEKLQVDADGVPGTDDREYPWLKVTRDRIKEKDVDILLSNPEAIDHLLVSNDSESRAVIGDTDGAHPIEHIIYDEAHVWSGVMGAGIRLLNDRLRHFFNRSDPQFTLVSATVKNPRDLAEALTGGEPISAIDFTTTSMSMPTKSPSLDGFEPCTLPELGAVLGLLRLNSDYSQVGFIDSYPELEEAVTTLCTAGLVTATEETLSITPGVVDWLGPSLDTAIREAIDRNIATSPNAVFQYEQGRNHVAKTLLEDATTGTHWRNFIEAEVPEVAALTAWFREATVGPVGFRHIDEVEDYVTNHTPDQDPARLQPLLALGRLAGVVTDRYHAFIKPPRKVYQCPECHQLRTRDYCQICSRSTTELQFCRTCHYPFYVGKDNPKSDDEPSPDVTYRPVEEATPAERCPDCGKKVKTSDIGVPTSSLLSFMLSEMVRKTPSNKTLVFSDSHSAAESIAKRIQETEYGLMAETLYVRALRENDGTATLNDLFHAVEETLSTEYYEPFHDPTMSHSGAAYSMIRQLRSQVTKRADLQNTNHLLDSSLVTSEVVYQNASSPFELVIGHELYTYFAGSQDVGFKKSSVSFDCLTIDKVYDRIGNAVSAPVEAVEPVVEKFLKLFLDAGIIHEADFDSVREQLNRQAGSGPQFDTLFDYLIDQGDKFANRLNQDDIESGLLTRYHKRDNSELRLVPKVAFCEICHATFPVSNDGKAIEMCIECGHPLEVYTRFHIADNGSYHGSGVADIDSDYRWALDHWAHDIMQPLIDAEATDTKNLPFVTVGIHKGNIPATLRGIIEEGFRKDPPDINVVSSTPTMELGVDIGSLETVAQVGMPPTLTNYVQRSGRTGRNQGSSSLVTTVIRGRHPVDNHYYQDLGKRFFDEFDPVRVPSPDNFEQVVAAHVVTEVFAYLARHPHRSNRFERKYQITDRGLTATEAVERIIENLESLVELITGEWETRLRTRIKTIFDQTGINAFEAVFLEDGSLNLLQRAEQTYMPLADSSTVQGKDIIDQAGRLNLWLDQLGYLASYRNFGHDFPVEIEGYNDNVRFESTGRLYDMFPGPENSRGAVFSLGGQEYLVNDVQGGRKLATTALCINDECPWPYQSYPETVAECPHCGNSLTMTGVHEIASVHCREACQGERNWTTSPLHTNDVTLLPTTDRDTRSTAIAGLPAEITRGVFQITEFVYAYERFHSSSDSTKILRSQAAIEEPTTGEPRFGPVGTQHQTSGLQFMFSLEEIRTTMEVGKDEDVPWPQFIVSLQQAMKRAVSILGRFDLGDFNVASSLTEETLCLTITDGRQGGNGVAWQLDSYVDGALTTALRDVILCDNCKHYCEDCLLLPRTPASYLENRLLDRQPLVALFT